jgi:hypothetical protein
MGQAVQLLGALLIISAYLASQQGGLRLDSVRFLALNMVGAAILSVVAFVDRQYGFLLLEGMWTWVSGRGFRRALVKGKEAKKRDTTSKRAKESATRRARRGKRPNPLRRVD